MKKTAYVAIASDIIHSGHMNVIEEAAKYGDVLIGLLTDEAIATYKRLPILDYETRERIFQNLKQVTKVIKQDTLSYKKNLLKYKPDYVVHGDNWQTGIQSNVRAEAIEVLSQYGGELIEVPYTEGISGTEIDDKLRPILNTPDIRRAKLRRLLRLKPYIRVMEASNGLSGLIVENARYEDAANMMVKEYDAMWVSSLCDSSFKGKPDIELVDFTSRINTINDIMEVTSKPIILDGDTGGKIEHFVYNVKTLERIGVSAVILEDKTGLKQNSLYGTDAKQVLDDPHTFAAKIKAGKQAQVTRDFMIIARLESLIAGMGMEDAMMRARIYINEGGADGIMIHSRLKDGEEIREFLRQFRAEFPDVPVILVPTSYNHILEEELCEWGANVIIHANHMLRSAYRAMKHTADRILECGRSKEVDDEIISIKEVLGLIPGRKTIDMINTKEFYDGLLSRRMDFFAGVPDSLLSNLCACIKENSPSQNNIIAANEGNAVAIASGYHIATGRYGVVYMQNSGLGNTVNPILSLANEDVYRIPMLLIVGWRGEPGKKDEPQHKKQGELTLPLLECMGIEYEILRDEYEVQLERALTYMKDTERPYALVVQKGIFSDYAIRKETPKYQIRREDALEEILKTIGKDAFLVSTTGKTSREIFEIRERWGQGHAHDFLTVGSMGHTASIALGMSIGSARDIYCIDGDGSFIMHMGGMGIVAKNAGSNFKYILINNGAHESVGGQPTIAFDIDVESVLKAVGFQNVYRATTREEVADQVERVCGESHAALVIYVNQGSRDDLGRPTIAPEQNKRDMMMEFAEEIQE